MSFIIAIDGPSGTGKGTISKIIADKFKFQYLDTGAMYRCVTIKIIREKVNLENEEKIKEILKNIKIDLDGEKVFLDGEDVTRTIREEKVTNFVSEVSKNAIIRANLVELQRRISEGKNIVVDGRDIGTVVFPNAEIKIYLDASSEERAKRRYKQNLEKGITTTLEEVKKNIEERDKADKERKIGALKKAEDATYIDTTKLSIFGAKRKVISLIKKKKKQLERIEKGYKEAPENWSKKTQRCIVKSILAFLYKLVYRPKIIGLENLPKDEGYIICANHVNYLDAAGMVVLNKFKVRFIGKADLLRFRILSWLARIFDIIPVKRNAGDIASIKLCLKALKNKEVLGIFPEGTRHGMDKNIKVKSGAVYLAAKAKVKIVPVGVSGSFKPFTRVTFNYGKPIDILELKTEDENWQENATEKVMNDIIMLTKQKD